MILLTAPRAHGYIEEATQNISGDTRSIPTSNAPNTKGVECSIDGDSKHLSNYIGPQIVGIKQTDRSWH